MSKPEDWGTLMTSFQNTKIVTKEDEEAFIFGLKKHVGEQNQL